MPFRSRLAAATLALLVVTIGASTHALAQGITVPTILPTTTTEPPATTTTTAPTTTTTESPTTTTTEPATTTTSTTASTTTTSTASTTTTTTTPGLGVSSPNDAVLGTAGASGSLTAQLGIVTITVAGSLSPQPWTVTVSASDFVNGTGGTLSSSNVTYASGPALDGSTMLLTTPGQPLGTPVSLTSAATAFSGVGEVSESSVSWNPTIVITVPPDSAEGEYHGTITHSLY